MKASQIAAKASVRLLLFLIIFILFIFLKQSYIDQTAQHIYITKNYWPFIFPVLLLCGFVIMLITCVKNKYSKPDLNWVLVVNAVMLIIYLSVLFYHLRYLIS